MLWGVFDEVLNFGTFSCDETNYSALALLSDVYSRVKRDMSEFAFLPT